MHRFFLTIGGIGRDIRQACRVFTKNPGFTAIAVLSIAFGTGANVAMFSAADALLLRPLPVPSPNDLLNVGFRTNRGLATTIAASHADYRDLRERTRSFEGLAAFGSRRVGIRTQPASPPRVRIATLVSANFFEVLRVQPALGRGFRADEDEVPGRDAVAVLSHGTWLQEFDGDASVLGRTIQIAGIDFTIVGIAPESFTGMEPRYVRDAIYVPLAMWPRIMSTPTVDPLTTRDLRTLHIGNTIDEHYFAALEIAILEGRAFTSADTQDSRPVAIVNETMARRYWPGDSAIGKRIRRVEPREMWLEVVGVASTTTYVYPGEEPQDAIYFPFRQDPRGAMVLLVQTAGDSSSLVTPLGEMVRNLDADVPQFDAQTIERFYDARVASIASVCTRMIGGMGVMGLTLTMVGLYGLVSYAVSRRTREIGVRIAIGATGRDVLVMILRQGLTPACLGVAVGLVLSAGAVRVLPTLTPFTHRIDPRWFMVMVPMLVLVSVLASLLPARRAARVDPTVALRCE